MNNDHRPEWEQRIRREHEMDKEPEPERPEDRWITKGGAVFISLFSLFWLLLGIYSIYQEFEWWKPLVLVFFAFMVGVYSGPLGYKHWFGR